jgi:hypothetical protein
VNDVKGLVLTCVALEIDTNADTNLFKSCTLAPSRTLDGGMHTFIQGIHYEQSLFEKEREEWQRTLEESRPEARSEIVKQFAPFASSSNERDFGNAGGTIGQGLGVCFLCLGTYLSRRATLTLLPIQITGQASLT